MTREGRRLVEEVGLGSDKLERLLLLEYVAQRHEAAGAEPLACVRLALLLAHCYEGRNVCGG